MKQTNLNIQFANEGVTILVNIANELSIDTEGWAQIAPMGDYPGMALITGPDGRMQKVKAIQRIDKVAIANMVNEFKAARKGVKKFLNGCPIYVGHPDVPGYASRYPDKSPKGVFADIAERNGGFYGMPIFTNEGSELVETKKLRALSGRWEAEDAGEENGVKIYRPTRFISAGLTNQPNLPVQLLNEAEPQNEMNKKLLEKIIGLCAKAGIQLANDATEAQTEAALEQLTPKVEQSIAFANELPTVKSSVTAKDTEIATLKTERDNFKTSFANERKARIGNLLDHAITSGRITAADRSTWENRLNVETSFANESEALGKLAPTVKTASVTLQRGDRKIELANASERREMVVELVNEEMETGKCSYDTAFAKVTKKFPQLFEAMTQPQLAGTKK